MATSTLAELRARRCGREKPSRQRHGRGDEQARARAVGLQVEAEDVLEVGQPVVAAEAHVVAEEGQHQGEGHRLGDDREIDAGDARAEGEPAEDEGQQRPAPAAPSAWRRGKLSKPYQYQGSSFQFRNTMKSGSTGLP